MGDVHALDRAYLKVRCVCDISLVLLALPLALVITTLTAIIIQCVSPGPLLFRQRRSGYRGREFVMIKLRTMAPSMTTISDGNEQLTTNDDVRTGAIAQWIRRHRLDELPQLWHVLNGEMALIGPRPVPAGVARTMTAMSPVYARRMDIRPGLTGLAQVRMGYSDDINGELRKLKYDLAYRDAMSPSLDLAIIAATVRTVIMGTGGR